MKFVIATENPGKLEEFARILAPLGIEAISLKELGIAFTKEETGTTFQENAFIKAMDIFQQTGLPTVADDSGLCVDYLEGAPGIHTARFGGEGLTPMDRVYYLLDKMKDVPKEKRGAQFISHITCVLDQNTTIEVEGLISGSIGFVPVGEGGFGYDPIFMVGEESFSQMDGKTKDAISHRGIAARDFVKQLTILLDESKETV